MTEPLAVGSYPGIEIAYHEKPWRHYLLNDAKVPSVTTAIGVLDKSGPLMHYAERVTTEGVRTLAQRPGYIFPTDLDIPEGARGFLLPASVDDSELDGEFLFRPKDAEQARKELGHRMIWLKKDIDVLTGTRMTVAHMAMLGLDHGSQTNEAALRGVDVHYVWEAWNERKEIPDAEKYPENRRGYIRGMAAFIQKQQPECYETEMIVGSAIHGFAGRLDTVVIFRTTKGMCLVDVKTAKDVYPNSHFPQLQAYEIARRECGLEPTEFQGILQLSANGDHQVAWSADPKWGGPTVDEDFLCLLRTYRSQQKFKGKGKKR